MNHLTFAGLHFLKQEKFLDALRKGISTSIYLAERKTASRVKNYDTYKKDYLQLIKRIQDD